MTQQHSLQVPSEVREKFLKQCGFYSEETPGFIDNEKFSELCATWGSDQEYQASYNFIGDAWGSDHARVYQESRRPKILSEKEEAKEALYYLQYWAAVGETDPETEKYEKIRKYGNVLSKLIHTLPD